MSEDIDEKTQQNFVCCLEELSVYSTSCGSNPLNFLLYVHSTFLVMSYLTQFPRISGFKLPMVRKIAPEFYDNLHSYDSWSGVIYDYIFRVDIGPYSRVRRENKRDAQAASTTSSKQD